MFELFFPTATFIAKLSVYVSLSTLHRKDISDQFTATRLAFYYRIFPIIRFRRLLLWVALCSVVFILIVVIVTAFQWFVSPYLCCPYST